MKTIPRSLITDEVFCVNYIIYVSDKGIRNFMYIAVRNKDLEEFKKIIRRGNFVAEDYGFVLEQGQGEATEIVKEKMKLLYNCDVESTLQVQDYNPEVI